MARPIRIEYAGAWYHITCRGNERRVIFGDDDDRKSLLEMLEQGLELYRIEVHAYVLMENHFHLILRTCEANLQKFMQRFNTSYTMYFNRKYKRSGHLYQGRYKALLVDADNYLLELSRYVHLNPVRIKEHADKSMEEIVDVLRQYEWSSYQGYIDKTKEQPFMSYGMILDVISAGSDQSANSLYERFVMEAIGKDKGLSTEEAVCGQAILGTRGFIEKIYQERLSNRKQDKKEQSGLQDMQRMPESIEEIVRLTAREYKIPEAELCVRRSSHIEARSVLIELSRRYMCRKMSLSAIGRVLGGITVSAISQNKKRFIEKQRKNEGLQRRIQKLIGTIEGDNFSF